MSPGRVGSCRRAPGRLPHVTYDNWFWHLNAVKPLQTVITHKQCNVVNFFFFFSNGEERKSKNVDGQKHMVRRTQMTREDGYRERSPARLISDHLYVPHFDLFYNMTVRDDGSRRGWTCLNDFPSKPGNTCLFFFLNSPSDCSSRWSVRRSVCYWRPTLVCNQNLQTTDLLSRIKTLLYHKGGKKRKES